MVTSPKKAALNNVATIKPVKKLSNAPTNIIPCVFQYHISISIPLFIPLGGESEEDGGSEEDGEEDGK